MFFEGVIHFGGYSVNKFATACIAALFACLTMQKNSPRSEPLAHFFTTLVMQIEPLYKQFNYGVKDYCRLGLKSVKGINNDN